VSINNVSWNIASIITYILSAEFSNGDSGLKPETLKYLQYGPYGINQLTILPPNYLYRPDRPALCFAPHTIQATMLQTSPKLDSQ
jgi:hypothetical protein